MYYVMEITKTTEEARALYAYNTKTEAMAKYHDTLGYAMKLSSCEYCMCMVLESNGNALAFEKYVREA